GDMPMINEVVSSEALQRVRAWLDRIAYADPEKGRFCLTRPYKPVQGIELRRFVASEVNSLSFSVPKVDRVIDCMKVVVQIKGGCRVTTRMGTTRIAPSQWMIHDFSREILIELSPDSVQLLLIFPADFFFRSRSLTPGSELVPFGVEPGVGRVAGGFLEVLDRDWASLSTSDQTDMIDTAAALIQLAINEHDASRAVASMQDTMRERIKSFVTRHLRDPKLSLDRIADHLGCTKRYLHKVFRGGGQTLSACIWDTRLQRCAADLADPANEHQSITQIAFSWGFNNSAHFSKMFKERYGVSARQYRLRPLIPIDPAGTSASRPELVLARAERSR
ncbi:helix-turn-helix transcriptional regulator, partial [Sphingomonas sp. ZT3P38]|uniref:AraC family transcriptional regulator n=1 Tax=Parasphingomonas zepuensis TaxID=3096161 RepID=UPI002FCC2EB7